MPDPTLDAASPWAELWTLDPAVAYLNHGSFGACPRAVLEHQAAAAGASWSASRWTSCRASWPGRLAEARAGAGRVRRAPTPDDLAFVTNATSGVNAVLRSLPLRPGDELLTTDHAYDACRKALEFVAARARRAGGGGARPVPARERPTRWSTPVLAAVTPRTRLALLDHVTSPTGLVFPIERLVRELRARGVDTLVDGAHALGMVPLDLERAGRRLLHRQRAQVAVRAEGRGVPATCGATARPRCTRS